MMLNRILSYGTAIGITLSFIGFLIMSISSTSEEFNSVIDKLYNLTLIFSGLFLLTISEFINRKFDKIRKTGGIILSIILIMNLMSELNIYEINNSGIINMILFSSLYFIYFDFFWKKQNKTKLSYLKIVFLTLLFIKGFLSQMELSSVIFENTIQILFWMIVVVEFIRKNANPKVKYAG